MDESRTDAAAVAAVDADRNPAGVREPARRGFLSRYRLPLLLAVVALCGYVGSIVYIVYFRGQIG